MCKYSDFKEAPIATTCKCRAFNGTPTTTVTCKYSVTSTATVKSKKWGAIAACYCLTVASLGLSSQLSMFWKLCIISWIPFCVLWYVSYAVSLRNISLCGLHIPLPRLDQKVLPWLTDYADVIRPPFSALRRVSPTLSPPLIHTSTNDVSAVIWVRWAAYEPMKCSWAMALPREC